MEQIKCITQNACLWGTALSWGTICLKGLRANTQILYKQCYEHLARTHTTQPLEILQMDVLPGYDYQSSCWHCWSHRFNKSVAVSLSMYITLCLFTDLNQPHCNVLFTVIFSALENKSNIEVRCWITWSHTHRARERERWLEILIPLDKNIWKCFVIVLFTWHNKINVALCVWVREREGERGAKIS